MLVTANKGTSQWTAPEALKDQKCTEKVDIYSLGVVVWELITRKHPWEGMTRKYIYLDIFICLG
jgi:serine/threonine protein kinase